MKSSDGRKESQLLPYEYTTPEENEMLDKFLLRQSPEVVEVIQYLRRKISMLEAALMDRDRRIPELERRIAELEARLNMNSSNSSKPPSSDGLSKPPSPKSLRGKSGRKQGGQPGHQGVKLEQVSSPDEIVRYEADKCFCGCSLEDLSGEISGRYQVFEFPEKPVLVTEHQVIAKVCPICGRKIDGELPEDVSPIPAQYGPRILTLALYLRFMQFIPYERLSLFFRTVLGVPLSKGTVELHEKRLYKNLESYEHSVRQLLSEARVLHSDETGFRAAGELHWAHAAVSGGVTLMGIFKKRGSEGIDSLGILDKYTGVLVHDCRKPYFNPKYSCTHALCCAHILRELQSAFENESHVWAKEMFELLTESNKSKHSSKDGRLTPDEITFCRERYRAILSSGEEELLPPEDRRAGTRGRLKRTKSANLHRRLTEYEDEVLLFTERAEVPFTNNLAERAIRMFRLFQKISGCTRTFEGAQRFVRIRSFIDTVRKQGHDIFNMLKEALKGNPFIPEYV